MILAIAVTCLSFLVAFVFPFVIRLFPNAPDPSQQDDAAEHD